ncbi:hypothetical protein KA005_01625 [bacterium]|nr:hypothetical protein [bacterium]
MTVRAVSRSLEQKETDIHELRHKRMSGSLIIVNGSVEKLSLSLRGVAHGVGNAKPQSVEVLNMDVNDAKSLYLLLRSMMSLVGDLEELDECAL